MAIYLDHAASVPISGEVLETYANALAVAGNPSSTHSFGQNARMMLEEAREQLALAVDCDRNEVIFTSGGTEANNLAVKGLFAKREGNLIVTSAAEHHAVLDVVEHLEAQGAEVHWLSVNSEGQIDLDELKTVLETRGSEVALVALMWVSNETGVITPIGEVTALAAKHGVPVHSDAVAAFGHMPTNFAESGLSTMAITAHKLGGPVGTGALIVSRATNLEPLFHGGGQERAIRAGTMDAAGALAFAVALCVCRH